MINDKKIKFSILTPVYNVQLFLEECIESILAQTYDNFELILVDDGSTDSSGSICDKYQEIDSRVKVYHKNNSGPFHTRLYSIDCANGDYFLFVDSDDFIRPNSLEILYKTICETQSDCVIFGFERVLNNNVIKTISDPQTITLFKKSEIYNKCFLDNNYNAICRKAVKKSVFKGLDYSSFYHIKHGEDLLQSLEILENSNKVTFIPDILYSYRINPDSITQTITYDNYNVDFTVREQVLNLYMRTDGIPSTCIELYRDYCVKIVLRQIRLICSFITTFKNKKNLLRTLRNERFFVEFVSKSNGASLSIKERITYMLFRAHFDNILLMLIK